MAPRGPVRAREYDYSNVGKAGRRTGITLKEGKRDEFGMEEIDGMFSSPDKSPARENSFEHDENNTAISSDGMSMDEGNGPGPVDFLNGINAGRSSHFPAPVLAPSITRSPTKAGLTGSFRGTSNLQPLSPHHDAPSSTSAVARDLESEQQESVQDSSPLTRRSINASVLNRAQAAQSRATENAHAGAIDFSDSDGDNQLNGGEDMDAFERARGDSVGRAGYDDVPDDQSAINAELTDRSAEDGDSPSASTHETEQANTTSKSKIKGKGRAAPTQGRIELHPTQAPKGRNRPKKTTHMTDDRGNSRPLKRTKTETGDQTVQSVNERLDPKLNEVVEDYANRTGPLKGRSLHILKRETPSYTRSGRVSIRPLAYWRNERCVYGDSGTEDGARYPTTTIKEIIRTEELEPEGKRGGKRSSKKSKQKKTNEASDNEDDSYADPWEKEGGVLHGYVRKWNPETQTGMDEDEVLDIAYAPSGIETRDVKDSTFKFAKLLSSSFLGSGIVELPPGGVKKPKNSKRMHMVFYVCHGRVQIDISGVQFSAGKGCVFQVPRGNYYSFANTSDAGARLFFTQGCIPTEGEATISEPTPRATNNEATSKPTGTKGRQKGKRKTGSKASQR